MLSRKEKSFLFCRMVNKTRKRRQRGGKTVQIKSRNLSQKTIYYTPANTSSIRNLVKMYFDKEVPNKELQNEVATAENPTFAIYQNKTLLNMKGKWNAPHEFKTDFETYTIFAHMAKRQDETQRKATEHVLPYIKQIIDKFARSGGKVIFYSSTATPDIPKNVAQQFDFKRYPRMPILHIDSGFFTDGHEPYQFYTILNFDSKPIIDFIRHYSKPYGKPLTLRSSMPTRYEQLYLEEVQRQASGLFNLQDSIDIYCAKYHLTEETENEIREYGKKNGVPVYNWSQS